MIPPGKSIMQAVQAAPVASSANPHRWKPHYPAFMALRAKGYGCKESVDFLCDQGAIKEADKGKALNAFMCTTSRKNRRELQTTKNKA